MNAFTLISLCLLISQSKSATQRYSEEKTAANGSSNERIIKANGSIKIAYKSDNVTKNGQFPIDGQREKRHIKLNMKQGLTMNQVLSFYALTEAENELCRNDSTVFADGLRNFDTWALQMFDASSKIQSGILSGNMFEYGSFQQCLNIYKSTPSGQIRGKHCNLKVAPGRALLQKILSFRNVSSQRFNQVYAFVKDTKLGWSACVPHSCDHQSVLKHFEKIFYTLAEGLDVNVSLIENDCITLLDEQPLNRTELGVIGAFGLYLILIVVATIVDLYSTPEEVSANHLVNIFSLYSNSRQIFAPAKKTTDLDCVQGMRCLTTSYVVVGHRYLMMMFFPVINSLQIMDWVVFYRSTFVTGATLCVDTFFMISGMLVSISYFEQMSTRGSINWPMFYVLRYLRITPPLAIVVLWYCTLIQRFGSGPMWNEMLSIVQKPCQEYWWATILHIQNYVHPFPLCMTQTWYLTCDMQYFFFSPIILVPLGRYPTLGLINYALIYILSVASNFYFAWINKYNGGVPVTQALFATKYFQEHYITPHTRAATYIIGLGFGYAVFRSRGTKANISYPFAGLCWLLCVVIMLASLVGCHIFHTEHEYNRLESTVYIAFSRSAWTLGTVWIVWACINGYGGPVNGILASYGFRVLARISYGVFLLHMLMQYLISGAQKVPLYFSDFESLRAAFGDLFMIVILGFIFTVCFESPLIKAINLLLKKGGKKQIHPDNDGAKKNSK